MMRTMIVPGSRSAGWTSPSRSALSALGLLLMYGNATDAEVDAAGWRCPCFLGVTIPVLWRRAAPLQAMAAVAVALAVHIALFGVGGALRRRLPGRRGARVHHRRALRAHDRAVGARGRPSPSSSAWRAADETGFGVVSLLVAVDARGVRAGARSPMPAAAWWASCKDRTQELRAARDERARLEVATDRTRLSGELDALLQRRLGRAGPAGRCGPRARRRRRRRHGDARADRGGQPRHAGRDARDRRRPARRRRRPDLAGAHADALAALLVLRDKGDAARLVVEGSPRVLPAGVELSAYRIVEHLLSALDDAPGVEVGVRFGEDALEIRVAGPAGRRGDVGAALGRARERAQLHRGSLDAHTRGGRAEAIALLPVAAIV